jgi:hypothetical protein
MNVTTRARMTVVVLALTVAVRPAEAQAGYPEFAAAAVRVPASVLERYAGEWVYPDGNSVMVRLRGDTLFREIPGQRVPLVPVSQTLFRLGPVFTAEFVTDRAGVMTQVLTDGVAVEFRLHRKGSVAAAPPAPLPGVRVSRPVLERYVGEYEYIPGQMSRTDLSVVIRLKGDTLYSLGSGLREVVLTPISETRFQLGSTSLMWEFVNDQRNGVTILMGTGSQQLKARIKSNP